MLNRNADGARTPLTGKVDFTMMYVAHDAFTRDLRRLTSAAGAGQTASPVARAGWAMLKKQLHIHHAAEDTSLWPVLRQKVTRSDHVAVIDAMEAEHARIDPQLDAVDWALAASDAVSSTQSVQTLGESLTHHMRHEENEALPLVETFLGPEGWAAFGRAIRKTQGLRAGAEYLPWVLDGAPIAAQAKFLGLLPPPVRLLYRRVWAPRYRRIPRWDGLASD
jgi:hypothetical protein